MFKINLTKIFGKFSSLEGRLIKAIIVVLIIFLLVSIVIVFRIQSQKTALSREYQETKQRLTEENKILFGKLNSVLGNNKILQDRLEVLQRDLERLTSERDRIQHNYELVNAEREALLETAEKYAQLEKEMNSLEDENKTQKEEIAALKKQNLQLQTQLSELRGINESLKQKIEQTEQVLEKEDATADFFAQEQESNITQKFVSGVVDLPTIVVSPQNSPSSVLFSSLKGKIINVNRRYNFVVINLGRNSGLRNGMIFEVFRKNNFVGKIEVIQLRENIAACDITQAYQSLEIDDIVRY